MCKWTEYFAICHHTTEANVRCCWNTDRYCCTGSLTWKGFCGSCNREELARALTGHFGKPRELAIKMLDAINEARRINEVRSIKEVGDVKELVTPEQVANFLKTSKRAKMLLRKTISEQSMEWVLYWLDNTLWPDPPVPVLNQDTLRHGAQPQSFLKQEQKNSVSSEQGHKTSYIDLVCHPQGAAINIDQSVQRSVACPDVGALRAPKRRVPSKRRFDQTLDLSGISNLDPGPSLKAPRLSLPDNKQKPDVQMQMPVFVPFSGPPLASQPVPANYPVKPTVPDCKITWIPVEYCGSASDPLWKERLLVSEKGVSDIPIVSQTRKSEPQIIPTMAPQSESDGSSPFRCPPELEKVLVERPNLQYVIRAESEPVGRTSTVIDCDD